MSGWLKKQGGRVKTWKKRWFVLVGNCLYYFTQPDDRDPLGIIPLENLEVRVTNERRFAFEIFAGELAGAERIKAVKSTSGSGLIKAHHDRYLLAASSQEELDAWLKVIQPKIVRHELTIAVSCDVLDIFATTMHTQQPASAPSSPFTRTVSTRLPPTSPRSAQDTKDSSSGARQSSSPKRLSRTRSSPFSRFKTEGSAIIQHPSDPASLASPSSPKG